MIREADLRRIFRAAKAEDVSVRVEVEPGGKVVIIPVEPGITPERNRWNDD
jgi:hypothetical protein